MVVSCHIRWKITRRLTSKPGQIQDEPEAVASLQCRISDCVFSAGTSYEVPKSLVSTGEDSSVASVSALGLSFLISSVAMEFPLNTVQFQFVTML